MGTVDRIDLVSYKGQNVEAHGQIVRWKTEYPNLIKNQHRVGEQSLRVTIKDVWIENEVFVDHINIFVSDIGDEWELEHNYDIGDEIDFSGIVKQYLRADGSTSFGIEQVELVG